jgi:3-oxoacyl-(acyl-carrier-protein) synthase
MQISISGGACIAGSSYITLESDSPIKLPEMDGLFNPVPARLGRFDDFTKLGFAVIGLALQDGGHFRLPKTNSIGLIISTHYGIMQTDLKYYSTTLELNGLLSSPNLFSYTLPVTVIGECANYFHLTGPTFCIGDDDRSGIKALETSMLLLRGGGAKRFIAACIECPLDLKDFQPKRVGAAAVVLDCEALTGIRPNEVRKGETAINIETVSSLYDFFRRDFAAIENTS